MLPLKTLPLKTIRILSYRTKARLLSLVKHWAVVNHNHSWLNTSHPAWEGTFCTYGLVQFRLWTAWDSLDTDDFALGSG